VDDDRAGAPVRGERRAPAQEPGVQPLEEARAIRREGAAVGGGEAPERLGERGGAFAGSSQ